MTNTKNTKKYQLLGVMKEITVFFIIMVINCNKYKSTCLKMAV